MKNKFNEAICAAILLLALMTFAACGNDDNNDTEMAIAIVTSLTSIDDMSFNQNNYEGIRAFIRANPNIASDVYHVHEPYGEPGVVMQRVADISPNFDVVVLPGFQFSNIGEVATANPDTYFILIDTHPEEFNGTNEFANVRALEFAEQESGFLAGVVAALKSESQLVAFVGGQAFPSLVNYQFGFYSGVNYANAVFGTQAQVAELPHRAGTDVYGTNIGGNYAGAFDDPSRGYDLANELLDYGVDIIFVAAGGTGLGVHRAVRQRGGNARLIGVDTDNFVEYGSNMQLTAVYKAMGLNVHRTLNSIAEGEFIGGNHTMHIGSNSVGITIAPGQHQLSHETINRVHELFGLLRDGIIVPASAANGYLPDNFPGLD